MCKKYLVITMFVVSAICFSGLSAFACDAALSANCTGFTFTGQATHYWRDYGVTSLCVDYSVTLTNAAGEIITTKSGSKEYSTADQTAWAFDFTITGDWGEELCGLNFAAYGVIKYYFNCDRSVTDELWYYEKSLGPVTFDCPCDTGCTLTPGYWKTHSQYGPAPYDDTWAAIGEDTVFFNSGKSWYVVINTPPARGNAYYILSFQFIAAKLNIINGATVPGDVNAALNCAQTFFNTYTPTSTLNKEQRAAAIQCAATLANYNSGIIGPGHCND